MRLFDWKQEGSIYLWYYEGLPKNYPGWHLTADNDGTASLIRLFSLLEKNESSSKKTISISKPDKTILSVANCKNRAISKTKASIFYEQNGRDLLIMEDEDRVNIYLNHCGLNKVREGLNDILSGKGDYSIGDGKNRIWFWWHPNG